MDYEQILTIDNLDVYVRTPDCWRYNSGEDLSCNTIQGLGVRLDNGVADNARAEVWIYASGGSRSGAYIYTAHTFDYSSVCLLDYTATVRRMLDDGVSAIVVDLDYTDSNGVLHTGLFDVTLRDGLWGMVSPLVLPESFRVVGGTAWRAALANRTTSSLTFRRWNGGSVAATSTVDPQECLALSLAANSADALEFGGIKVPVVTASCGAVMLTWKSKEDGALKSYAFDVAGETLPQSGTAEVSVSGLSEWWQTGGGRKRLRLPACAWDTWRYIRDLNISDNISMSCEGYDAGGNKVMITLRVRMVTAMGGAITGGKTDIEFEIETWGEEAVWAR